MSVEGIIPESLSEFEVIHCIGKPCGLLARLHHVVLYYMSKHAPWMNQVEIWLSILVRKLLKRGNFPSLDDLRDQILAFIAYYNHTMAKPIKWTYTGIKEAA